jgi:hypothetical protein
MNELRVGVAVLHASSHNNMLSLARSGPKGLGRDHH